MRNVWQPGIVPRLKLSWLAQGVLLLLLSLLAMQPLTAQTAAVVPDLTGLNVPRAAAELNRAGLRMGTQTDERWTAASTLPLDTISGQSAPAGSTLEPGAAVDLVVLRAPNLRVQYDNNDLTLINLTDKGVSLSGLVFRAEAGGAAFTRWSGDLRRRACLQVWSVGRNGPKDLPDCRSIQNWLTTNNPAEHFWIAGSSPNFLVQQEETTTATCPTAPAGSGDQPLSCDFYLASGGAGGITDYVYFMYSADRLVIFNASDDKWMRLNKTVIRNLNPRNGRLGASFKPADPDLFGNPDIVADIKRLAPGQCLLFKNEDVTATPLPQACDVIAQLDLPARQLFWSTGFEYEDRDGQTRRCPPAVADKRTMCVMPR